MPNTDYHALVEALDAMHHHVSDWEADFLESLLQQMERPGFRFSLKQQEVLDNMQEKYLL